ncbi:MAG: DoxX family membrane protein [Desulfobacteraceae bacterium]|nr:DoxX family membrane protein [Desulfobacteraceae bacterium]
MANVTEYTLEQIGKVFGGLISKIFSERQDIRSIWLYLIIRLILGGIFIWAGASKLVAPKAFAQLISAYELVPGELLLPVAIGLPLLELIAGIGMIFDIRGSLEVVTVLLLLFAFVLWFGFLKGLDIDCGCFSLMELREHEGLRYALYRDFLFLGLALYLFVWRWIHAKSHKI